MEVISSLTFLFSLFVFSHASYVWRCPPGIVNCILTCNKTFKIMITTVDLKDEGDKVSINVKITSNQSYSVSWDTPVGGVALIHLEYECFAWAPNSTTAESQVNTF